VNAFPQCTNLIEIKVATDNPNYASINGVLYDKDIKALIKCPETKTSITIPNTVTKIASYSFMFCSGLTEIIIPNSVTSIDTLTFAHCTGLTEIIIPNSVTSIGESAFYNCPGIISFTIGNSVTSIGDGAFVGCINLTSIIISNTMTSIGERVFDGCIGLTSVTIPNSVTSIGSSAFYNCNSLTSISIPNSVTSIGDGAFASCSNLTSIICYATIPPSFFTREFFPFLYGAFTNVPKTIPLFVPKNSINDYEQADEWKDFTNILAIVDAGEDQTICYGSSVTLISTEADTYLWSTGATTATITVTPTATTTYIVTVTKNGITTSDEVVVTLVNISSEFTFNNNRTCAGDYNIDFNVNIDNPVGTNYNWDFGDATTATGNNVSHKYDVVYSSDSSAVKMPVLLISNLGGCIDSSIVDVSILPRPNPDSVAIQDLRNDNYVCAVIEEEPMGSGNYVYRIFLNNYYPAGSTSLYDIDWGVLPVQTDLPYQNVYYYDYTSTGPLNNDIKVTSKYVYVADAQSCESETKFTNVKIEVGPGNPRQVLPMWQNITDVNGCAPFEHKGRLATMYFPGFTGILLLSEATEYQMYIDDVFVRNLDSTEIPQIIEGVGNVYIGQNIKNTFNEPKGCNINNVLPAPFGFNPYEGPYKIDIKLANSCGTFRIGVDVNVYAKPQPDYALNAASNYFSTNTEITFDNQTIKAECFYDKTLNFNWSFGDNTSSSNNSTNLYPYAALPSTKHTYSLPGSYIVNMAASYAASEVPPSCKDTSYKQNVVHILKVNSDFNSNVVCLGNNTTITDATTYFPEYYINKNIQGLDTIVDTIAKHKPYSWEYTIIDSLSGNIVYNNIFYHNNVDPLIPKYDPYFSFNITLPNDGYFKVKLKVTNEHGITDSTYKYVYVNKIPVANSGSDVIIYNGDSTQLNYTGTSGDSIKWSNNIESFTQWVKPTITTTYTMTIYSNGCSDSDNLVVTVYSFDCAKTTNLFVNNISPVTVKLNWDNDVYATSYMLRWRIEAGPGSWMYYNATAGQNYVTIGNLTASTTYEWQMRKFCNNGLYSDFTDLSGSEFTTSIISACNQATPNSITNIKTNQVTLNWATVVNNNGYMVRWRVKSPQGAWVYYNATSGENTCDATGLKANTSYEWQMRTFCENNTISAFTELAQFVTLPSCADITNLSQIVDTTVAILKWNPVNGADHYLLRWRVANGLWKYININNQIGYQQIGCFICNQADKLLPNTTYEWQIRAFCNSEGTMYSNFSAIQQFETLENKNNKESNTDKFSVLNSQFSINIYPNPANDILNITTTASNAKNLTVDIYDIYGKLIMKEQLIDNLQLDIKHLESGIYFIKIENQTLKFIKQ